jgi:hypothetical protein
VYCDYFVWCLPCTVVVLTYFVICECVYVRMCVRVGFVMCGWFSNMCTCIYGVFVLILLCIFILIYY